MRLRLLRAVSHWLGEQAANGALEMALAMLRQAEDELRIEREHRIMDGVDHEREMGELAAKLEHQAAALADVQRVAWDRYGVIQRLEAQIAEMARA